MGRIYPSWSWFVRGPVWSCCWICNRYRWRRWSQRNRPTAKALRWNDPHSYLRRGPWSVRIDRRHLSLRQEINWTIPLYYRGFILKRGVLSRDFKDVLLILTSPTSLMFRHSVS